MAKTKPQTIDKKIKAETMKLANLIYDIYIEQKVAKNEPEVK